MSIPVRQEYAPILTWFLRKNPLYLLSAGTMAVAARLCIADAGTAAGSLYLIALTLFVLQFYEWLVIALLFALRHFRKAPEDEPSLLIVGALFWTGPIAATIEMTVLDPKLGALLCGCIGCIALAELALGNRMLSLRLSKAAWGFAVLAVFLVSILPIFLRTAVGSNGWHELVLYGGWWIFALYLPLGALGRDARRRLPFTLILAGATAVHLIGMNHAFWCHASAFYASPAMISLAFLLLHVEAKTLDRRPWFLAAGLFLPILAVGLCVQDFSRPVPIDYLPGIIQDMMSIAFLGTGAVWYYACWLRPASILLHGGTAAVFVGVYRILTIQFGPALDGALPWIGLYTAVAYLLAIGLLRRSGIEIAAAVAMHAVAVSLLVWDRVEYDELLVKSIIGWSALGVAHILYRRPEFWLRLLPIFLLVQAGWVEGYSMAGFVHGASLVITLIVVGLLFRWTRYLWIGLTLATAGGAALSIDGFAGMARPWALALVAAFALLIIGGYISWRKARWLEKLSAGPDSDSA